MINIGSHSIFLIGALAAPITGNIAFAQTSQASVAPAQFAIPNTCGTPTPEQMVALAAIVLNKTYLPGPPLAGTSGNASVTVPPTVPGSSNNAVGAPVPQIADYLHLTDVQAQSISLVRTTFEQFAAPLRQQISMLEQDIAVQRAQETPDTARIAKDHAAIEAVMAQMRDESAHSRSRILALLSEDQRSILSTLQNALNLLPAVQAAVCSGMLF